MVTLPSSPMDSTENIGPFETPERRVSLIEFYIPLPTHSMRERERVILQQVPSICRHPVLKQTCFINRGALYTKEMNCIGPIVAEICLLFFKNCLPSISSCSLINALAYHLGQYRSLFPSSKEFYRLKYGHLSAKKEVP